MAMGRKVVAVCFALCHVVVLVNGSIPDDLSNFLNEYVCDTRVRLVRPRNIGDVQAAIRSHTHAVPNGIGFSFNKEFSCAKPVTGKGETSANIVMSTMRRKRIEVDEDDMSVWASAGMPIRDLMTHLADYVTPSSPRGYTLGALPFSVDPTIGGAIATETRGSSLQYGSLSDQVVGFRVVLANGTWTEIDPDSYPLYFRAFQVNVGRLGVVTDVKMRIVRETLAERRLHQFGSRKKFLSKIRETSEVYASGGVLPEKDANAMYFISMTENATFWRVTLERLKEESREKTIESDSAANLTASRTMDGRRRKRTRRAARDSKVRRRVAEGVEWTVPDPYPPNTNLTDPDLAQQFNEVSLPLLLHTLEDTVGETHEAAFVFPPRDPTRRPTLVDNYEVAVSLSNAPDCLDSLLNLAESLTPDNGHRYPILLRLVGKAEGLLSAAYDEAVLWIDLTDFRYYNQEPRASNLPFKQMVAHLLSHESCSPGRLHWGKSGWPDFGCWNGAEVYGNNWCDFGCVVRALDPEDKFTDLATDKWNWNGANLDRCCTDDGYDISLEGCGCSVVPVRSPEACPGPPFYTNR